MKTWNERHKREEIARLLDELNLYLHYNRFFDRLFLFLKDSDGNTLWQRRGIDLVQLRDELLEYLKTIKSNK